MNTQLFFLLLVFRQVILKRYVPAFRGMQLTQLYVSGVGCLKVADPNRMISTLYKSSNDSLKGSSVNA